MKKQFRLTKEGIQELEAELKELIAKRGGIAEAIKNAREQGDLSENAEYHAAKDEHERTEIRISEIEHILQNVEVIRKPKGDSKVQLGSTVKLSNKQKGEKVFTVVGTVEADPLSGKISDESPIGRALLGKKEGEEVEINTPSETTTFTVADIS
jgi:transcription elongation factor GreA